MAPGPDVWHRKGGQDVLLQCIVGVKVLLFQVWLCGHPALGTVSCSVLSQNALGSVFLASSIIRWQVARVLALVQNLLACRSKPHLCIIVLIRQVWVNDG